MRKLFLPGFGASGRHYARGLRPGWRALDPPDFHTTDGMFSAYQRWAGMELQRSDEPAWLAGHSLGGALALVAAVAHPTQVARLTLISPAGLPLCKPIAASLALFGKQLALRRYRLRHVAADAGRAVVAPRATLRLARAVRGLDLSAEMRKLRELRMPIEVVGCATDTLVTPGHCRTAADLLGAEYRELDLPGGHMWMLEAWPQLARLL